MTRARLAALSLSLLLAFGATACDDTEAGLEEDTEELGDEVEQGADELEQEVEGED